MNDKPAPRRVLYWVVRMGRVRGRGEYVCGCIGDYSFCERQKDARPLTAWSAGIVSTIVGGRRVAVVARKVKR